MRRTLCSVGELWERSAPPLHPLQSVSLGKKRGSTAQAVTAGLKFWQEQPLRRRLAPAPLTSWEPWISQRCFIYFLDGLFRQPSRGYPIPPGYEPQSGSIPPGFGPDWAGSRCFFKAHVLEKTNSILFSPPAKTLRGFVYSLNSPPECFRRAVH